MKPNSSSSTTSRPPNFYIGKPAMPRYNYSLSLTKRIVSGIPLTRAYVNYLAWCQDQPPIYSPYLWTQLWEAKRPPIQYPADYPHCVRCNRPFMYYGNLDERGVCLHCAWAEMFEGSCFWCGGAGYTEETLPCGYCGGSKVYAYR